MTRKVLRALKLDKVKDFIRQQSPETKIYIGSDSERFKMRGQWYADYMVVIAVHINGKNGCKVFGEVIRERDFDQKKDRPSLRLMSEVHKVAEVFNRLKDVLDERENIRVDLLEEEIISLLDQIEKTDRNDVKFHLRKRVSELETKLKEDCIYQVHLDINPNKIYGSSCVIDQAVGYIKGTCNVIPLVKPNAFAASFAADRGIELINNQ